MSKTAPPAAPSSAMGAPRNIKFTDEDVALFQEAARVVVESGTWPKATMADIIRAGARRFATQVIAEKGRI